MDFYLLWQPETKFLIKEVAGMSLCRLTNDRQWLPIASYFNPINESQSIPLSQSSDF
jgi:hypothetical protein